MILNRGGEAFIIIFILFGKIFNLDYLIEQRTDNLSLQERSPPSPQKNEYPQGIWTRLHMVNVWLVIKLYFEVGQDPGKCEKFGRSE